MKSNIFFFIFCLIGFVLSFECENNYQCQKLEYCSIKKECEKKPKNICIFNEDCKNNEICKKENRKRKKYNFKII